MEFVAVFWRDPCSHAKSSSLEGSLAIQTNYGLLTVVGDNYVVIHNITDVSGEIQYDYTVIPKVLVTKIEEIGGQNANTSSTGH